MVDEASIIPDMGLPQNERLDVQVEDFDQEESSGYPVHHIVVHTVESVGKLNT